jgi:hypothetical protein
MFSLYDLQNSSVFTFRFMHNFDKNKNNNLKKEVVIECD